MAIWAECGISLSDVTALAQLGRSYALISGDALWLLEPAATEDIEPRREVSVYCLDPGADDFLGPVLAAVNAAEPALYAYTLHDPDADMETRISTLAALYASGEGPELICLGGIDPLDYIGSGWFADIYDLMESQGGMSRDELVAPGPYELGGALYSLPAAFGISTMLGRESRFGQYYSLYAPDIIDLDSKISPDQVLSRDELYSLICTTLAAQLRLGELPEAESLTALLELAAEPRKTSEYIPPEEAFGADMVMLGYQYLYNARSLAEAEAAAGCELWPVGAPTGGRGLRLRGEDAHKLGRQRRLRGKRRRAGRCSRPCSVCPRRMFSLRRPCTVRCSRPSCKSYPSRTRSSCPPSPSGSVTAFSDCWTSWSWPHTRPRPCSISSPKRAWRCVRALRRPRRGAAHPWSVRHCTRSEHGLSAILLRLR